MEDTTFYRATLRLERVEPYTEEDSILDRGTEIAYIALTGDTPAEAMEQIYDHAETLYGWHRTKADDRAALDEGVPLTLHDLSDRLRDMFAQRDEQTARAEAKKVIDDIVAAEAAHGEPETPLADWERDLLAAQARHDNAVEPERPFVACKAPNPLAPNEFCGRDFKHSVVEGTACIYVPVEELPASADDEGSEAAQALGEKPAPTAWCGDPDHDDPCDKCDAVLADASDALRQRMPTGEPKDAPIALGAPIIPARMWPNLLTGQ